MGREANITPDQVHAIADAIRAEGGKPTLRAVRERLGTGSMGTVSKHLQQWKAGQERQAATELALPPALQRAVLDFMATELAAARAPLEAARREVCDQCSTSTEGRSWRMFTRVPPMTETRVKVVGMVSGTAQWWLDVRKPEKDEVVAHLVNLTYNGFAHLEHKPRLGGG